VTGHKLFFALRPDEETAERIAAVAAAEHEARGLQPRLRPSRIFHITLHYFGYFEGEPDARIVELASRAADGLVGPPFGVSFDSFRSWGKEGSSKHPFVLTGGPGLEAVRELQRTLVQRLVAQGFGVPELGYVPHLTLRYDRRSAPDWPVELPGWIVDEFVLVKSPQGETRHDIIRRWPLRE